MSSCAPSCSNAASAPRASRAAPPPSPSAAAALATHNRLRAASYGAPADRHFSAESRRRATAAAASPRARETTPPPSRAAAASAGPANRAAIVVRSALTRWAPSRSPPATAISTAAGRRADRLAGPALIERLAITASAVLTVERTAAAARVSPATVRRWCRLRPLAAFQAGRGATPRSGSGHGWRGWSVLRWTGPARPFFSVVGVPPPDGLEPPSATQRPRLVSGGWLTWPS